MQSKYLHRLDVLRNRPRLTIASEVPAIITDYDCSSWLNGKPPAKSRETKIWLIIVHSVNNFIRSELPAWKSDMAVERDWKAGEKCDRNGEPFYTTTLQMHYNALTLTSNSLTEREYWFFDSDSSSNQSVQSRRCVWILLVMVASASSLHIQLLSSNYSVYFNSYIPTHHQDLHIRSQRAKQKTNHMKYHAPQMATGSKTNIETSWNSSNKHPSDMFSGRKKTNEIHMLYRCSSQFCKDLIRHI